MLNLSIKKSILATLVYYDVLDYPLTAWEIFKFLTNPARFSKVIHSQGQTFMVENFGELVDSLEMLLKNGQIESQNGFYFLPDRFSLCEERTEKNKIAEQKWKKARRYLFWAQAIPYIEAIFASGSLALGHANKESDLDVLVVTKRGRIWLARVLLSLAMSFLGVRRKNKELIAPDKICLNHYLAIDSLKIPFISLYSAQTYAHLIPVFWRDKSIIKKFWGENRGWVEKFLCHWELPDLYQKKAIRINKFLLGIRWVLEKILDRTKLADWLERFLKPIQMARIDTTLPGRITANDRQLEFHPYSAERGIIGRYNQTIAKLGIFGNYQETDSGLQ